MRFPTIWHLDMHRLRRACAVPFKLRNSKRCNVGSSTLVEYFKGPAKTLIRLFVCAGLSEPLMVTYTTLSYMGLIAHGWIQRGEETWGPEPLWKITSDFKNLKVLVRTPSRSNLTSWVQLYIKG